MGIEIDVTGPITVNGMDRCVQKIIQQNNLIENSAYPPVSFETISQMETINDTGDCQTMS